MPLHIQNSPRKSQPFFLTLYLRHLELSMKWPCGSAGVPPACYPVACRSVSLRCGARPPCRRERHGLGRSRVPAPLPVDPGGADGRSCAKTCAGGTPALPGWASSHDVVAAKEVHRSSCLFVARPQQQSSVCSSNDLSGSAGAALACSRDPPLTALHSSLISETGH